MTLSVPLPRLATDTEPLVVSFEPAPVIVTVPLPLAAFPNIMAPVETSPPAETVKSPVPPLPTMIWLPSVHCEPVPVTVTRPALPAFKPKLALALETTWPPLETVMTPRPVCPMVCVLATFQREPAPVTVAVPTPVPLVLSVTIPAEETSPPAEIVSVPSPKFPMLAVEDIVHDEPMPLTVAAPSAPSSLPSVTIPAFVRVPPLVTLKVPVPACPTSATLVKSATAFGPVIVIVPVAPETSPMAKVRPLIRPLSLTVSVPAPLEPMKKSGRSAAVPRIPPVVTVRKPVLPVAVLMNKSSPFVSTPTAPSRIVSRPVCPETLPMNAAPKLLVAV